MRVNVALIQMSCGADVRQNIDKAAAMVQQAAADGANIVCLQELFASNWLSKKRKKLLRIMELPY